MNCTNITTESHIVTNCYFKHVYQGTVLLLSLVFTRHIALSSHYVPEPIYKTDNMILRLYNKLFKTNEYVIMVVSGSQVTIYYDP